MMKISRRAFFGLAPASVGAIALGAAVLPKAVSANHIDVESMLDQMIETTLIASERMAHPALVYVTKHGRKERMFAFEMNSGL